MASADTLAPLIAAAKQAAAEAGVQWFEANEAALIAKFEPVADADLTEVVDGAASHLQMNGLASVMEKPAQNAIEGEVPQLVTLLNQTIEGGAAWFDGWMKQIASGTAQRRAGQPGTVP